MMAFLRQLFSLLPRVKTSNRILQTVERVTLTQHHTLHVVRVHGREVVLATYPNGCTVIDVERGSQEKALKASA